QLTLFTQAPVTDATLASINPLGHTIAPGHVFPSDHLYMNFNPANANVEVNVYAPSDGWVTQVTEALNNGTPVSYSVAFQPCAEVTLNFLSINFVAPAVLHPSGVSITQCSSDSQG